MRLPVNEKNLMDIRSVIESIFTVGERSEQFTFLSIYRAESIRNFYHLEARQLKNLIILTDVTHKLLILS